MQQHVDVNWVVLAVALVVVLLIARWLFIRASKPAQRSHGPDVLDEGAAPAQRNQALIDAPPAAQVPPVVIPPASEILGGIGEVVAAAAHEEEVDAVPAPAPAPESAAPAPAAVPSAGTGDDLTRIKGLGPKLKVMLDGLGIASFAQIAAWTEEDIARIDPQLGAFAGRPARDNWVEQAKLLASGDTTGFEARFGKV